MNKLLTRHLSASQDKLLSLLFTNPVFASKQSYLPVHARLGSWAQGSSGKVLELGCGPGKYVAMLASLGFSVVGIDPYEFPSWETLRQNNEVTLLSSVSAESLPFVNQEFDSAVCLGALLYFDDPLLALQELHRVLKPNAKLALRTVNRNNFYTLFTGKRLDPSSKQLYSMSELNSLLVRAGFTPYHSFSYGFWPPFLTNFYWYLINTLIPQPLQDLLSALTPPGNRVNNTIFALRT